jgi:hypothetical protein
LASNLVRSLSSELREIGLKSFRLAELFTFGTRVMRELLIACRLSVRHYRSLGIVGRNLA